MMPDSISWYRCKNQEGRTVDVQAHRYTNGAVEFTRLDTDDKYYIPHVQHELIELRETWPDLRSHEWESQEMRHRRLGSSS